MIYAETLRQLPADDRSETATEDLAGGDNYSRRRGHQRRRHGLRCDGTDGQGDQRIVEKVKKWTLNRHANSEFVFAATIPSKPSATSVPTLEITMTGFRPTRSDNARRMIVPPRAPKPIADITAAI